MLSGGAYPLDAGQLSIVFPGYPGRDPKETDAAARYRRKRDAAHLDGLLPHGSRRRRHMTEPAAFILGIPLDPVDIGASPLVVWEGSHLIMAQTFTEALGTHPLAYWPDIDLTDVYWAARKKVFETCERRCILAHPGEVTFLHRLTLHGVAPWGGSEAAQRTVAYFRPQLPASVNWLTAGPALPGVG
ncbi:MAG: hypothetical protein ACU0DW_04195 [Shimia sp.]